MYFKAYDSNAQPIFGEFRANAQRFGRQEHQRVAMDRDGDFVIVWHSSGNHDGDGYGVYGRRYNAAGLPLGGEFLVNTTTAGSQREPNIAMDNAGNFTVVWDNDGRPTGRSFDAAGSPDGGEFRLDTVGGNGRPMPDVAMDFDGDFATVWTGYGATQEVYGRRFAFPAPARNTVTGQKFHDQNANSIKEPSEPGMANWSIYHDLNNNSQFETGSYTALRGVGATLPARGTRRYLGAGPGSAVGAVITDVDVRLNVQFPTDADLTAWVISPGGRRVELFSNVGGNGDNFIGTDLDDASPIPITIGVAPFTGAYRPEGALAALQRRITDRRRLLDAGDQQPGQRRRLCDGLVRSRQPLRKLRGH